MWLQAQPSFPILTLGCSDVPLNLGKFDQLKRT